jgi:hypothetical protein
MRAKAGPEMMPRGASIALAALVNLACPAFAEVPPLLPPDLPLAVDVALDLRDPETGKSRVEAEEGKAVRLVVSLTDATTGQPPRGLAIRGFARPMRAGAGRCEQAARAYLTTGAVAEGAVSFDTAAFVVLNEDASLGVIDPRLNLQSANMIAAHRLPEMASGLAVDSSRARLLVSLPGEGAILNLPLTGGDAQPFAAGLTDPGALLYQGDQLWAATATGLHSFGADGEVRERHPLGLGKVRLLDDGTGGPLAYTSDGVMWRDSKQSDLGFRVGDLAPAGPGTVIAVVAQEPEARVIYADVPDRPVIIPLGRIFQRVTPDPEARFALAWSPGDPSFAVIDLALGRVVQAGALGTGTVSAVYLGREKGFLQSHDGGLVAVLDLGSVRAGQAVQMTAVRLGTTSPTPDADAGPLLLPLGETGQIMAVDPGVQTGFLIDAMAAIDGQPPMEAARLRGGVPRAVHLADRRLIEVASGQFEVTWAFSSGAWELVLTSGPGGLTRCLPFAVRGDNAAAEVIQVRMQVRPQDAPLRAGKATLLEVRFQDAEGVAVAMPPLELLVPAMNSSWREVLHATPREDGTLVVTLTPPHAGAFAIQPMRLPVGMALRSADVLMVED